VKNGGISLYTTVILIVVISFLLIKNKGKIKKVSFKDKLFVAGTFVCVLLIAFAGIYYAGNWISGFISSKFLRVFIQIGWILIVLGFANWIWQSVLNSVKLRSGIE
jgi:hypothetical protein